VPALFLSYARGDTERVRALALALERAGHEVWWDRHIAGGQEYSGAIEQALADADAIIVCWSANSVGSAWVRDEAAAGRDRGRLIPVTVDGSLPPLGFRQYQTIDLCNWNGRPRSPALDPLKSAIVQLAGSPQRAPESASPVLARRRRLPFHDWRTAAVLVLALLVVGGGLLYSRLSAGGPLKPEVAIGDFSQASANLPADLSGILKQEIVAAFGAENAVTVVAPGNPAAASAPFVMNGSISRLGDTVRFTVNLLNRGSGVVLWSGSFEPEGTDTVAARQAAVGASQVVRCGLWGASSYQRQMSDQALSLYLKWCSEHWSGSSSGSAELDAARRVTVAVSDFSFGWSALALATTAVATADSPDAARLRREGMAAARRSMALDDHNPEGYMAIAGLMPLARYAEREALLKKAISVRPTECGCERQAYGDFLASVGRMAEAAEQYERARAMRPLAPFSNLRFAQALYMIGRNDEADQVLTDTLELWPDATSLRLLKMKSALWTGRYDDAVTLLRSPDLPLTSNQRAAFSDAFTALKSGDPAGRGAAAAKLQGFAADPRYNDRLVVGTLAALGARQAALAATVNLVRERGLFDAEVLFEPHLAVARGEPAYARLVHDLGLTAYWRQAGAAPDICRDPAPPQIC
jgi:tetratricopeptide (TPR) repeat protein